jgi:hypothetical protein
MNFLASLMVITPITTIFSNRNPQNLSLCFGKLGNQTTKMASKFTKQGYISYSQPNVFQTKLCKQGYQSVHT